MGSCRLYEPFLAAVHANRLRMAYGVSTSFVYSAGEAAQYLAFCSGRKTIPEFAWPYVFSDPRTTPPAPELIEMLGKTTLCVAEISTLDQLTSSGFYFNWNELGLRFVRGKGPENARWWREVTDRRKRKASEETVAQVLEARRAAGEECSDEFAHFLRDMRFETLDEIALRSQLEALTKLSGQRWLFVSHLNIAESGPEMMADRRLLLETLRGAAGALGHSVFDPTAAVAKFGWRRALQGNGADKHHYTAEFCPVLGQTLMTAIREMIPGNDGDSANGAVAIRNAARTAVAAEQWGVAVAAWERLRTLEPDEVDTFLFGAEALRALGQLDEAEALALDATKRFPDTLWALHIYAGIAVYRGHWAEALHRWETVRLRFPNDPGAAANIANVLIELKREQDAIPLLHWLVEHHPDWPDGWIGLAKQALHEKQLEEAIRRWQDVRERFPDLPVGWGFGVESLAAAGHIYEADTLASEGLARFSDNLWLAHTHATLPLRHDNLIEGAARWAKVREHFPNDPAGYELGGQILSDNGADRSGTRGIRTSDPALSTATGSISSPGRTQYAA